jgi:hypothetical protein
MELLSDNKAICLRYPTPIDAALGRLSYHVVYDKPSYELDSLSRFARQNIRRGLKNCSIEAISFKRLVDEGWVSISSSYASALSFILGFLHLLIA